MINIIKEKIATYLLSRYLKGKSNPEINFNAFFASAQNVLLVYPDSNEEIPHTKELLDFLIKSGKKVSILVADFRLNLLGNLKNINSITYSFKDQTKLKLPSNSLRSELAKYDYDILINANTNSSLFFDAISAYSSAKIKIGFTGKNSDLFYNFQIPAEINTKNSYGNLLNSFKMF